MNNDRNPTQDLLDFYKNKASDCEKEIKNLDNRIDEIQKNSLNQQTYWEQTKEKNEEIFHLQSIINKMQICMVKEKENNLRLNAENDQLRIRNIENKKRLQEFETILFSDESKSKTFKSQTSGYYTLNNLESEKGSKDKKKFSQIDELQVKALKLEIEEQRNFISVQLEKVIQDTRLNEKNFEEQIKKESLKQKNLIKRLTSTQELLCQTARDLADLKRLYYKNEEIYKLKEVSLRNTIIELRSQLQHIRQFTGPGEHLSAKNGIKTTSLSTDNLSLKLTGLGQDKFKDAAIDKRFKAAQEGFRYYKEKVLELENEYEILTEKYNAERQIYSDRNEALNQKLKASETKYQNLLKRRNFDKQGYQADINLLKDKIKQLEKLLYKATITLGNESKNQQVLDNMAQIAAESKKLIEDEKKSRLQLLELEDKLRSEIDNP